MKSQSTKLLTLLIIASTTSAFSKTRDEKLFCNISHNEHVLQTVYKEDTITSNPYRTLTAKGKTEYIEILKTLIWFSQKRDVRKNEIVNTIQNDLDVSYLFLALQDFSFDTEGFENAESYKNLFTELIKVAGVQKKIEDLRFVRVGNLINISVSVNNSELKYSVDINKNKGWIDSNFIEHFLNEELLPKAGITERFFFLPAIDQIGNLILISEKEFGEATKAGLIPANEILTEYFFIELILLQEKMTF